MVYGPAERAQLCEDIGDALFRLITKVMEAEVSIFSGSPQSENLLQFVQEGSAIIDHLEAVYLVLEHSVASGPGPYSQDELAAALGQDRDMVGQVLDELADLGILNRRSQP